MTITRSTRVIQITMKQIVTMKRHRREIRTSTTQLQRIMDLHPRKLNNISWAITPRSETPQPHRP